MKKMLLLNGHPTYNSDESISNELMGYFKKKIVEHQIDNKYEMKEVNLYEEFVPRIDEDLFTMWSLQDKQEDMTSVQKKQYEASQKWLELWKETDIFVLSIPTHNFNVPSKLKDLFDNVLIAGETFRYTENGAVGMLDGDRKAILIQASGSIYTEEERYKKLDFAPRYVKEIFNHIGVEDFSLVRAQGVALREREEIIKESKEEIDELVKRLKSE